KETGAYLPRTAWNYATERDGSPPAVSLGTSVYTSWPKQGQLFRVDLKAGVPFNTDWVSATPEQEKAGEVFAVTKLWKLGRTWESPSADTARALNRGMLVAGDRLVVATSKGQLL